jgi:hypothetical protein
MRKILLGVGLLSALGMQQAHAQLALENFNTGLPATWSMIKVDNNTVNASAFAAPIPTVLTAQAWMTRLRATGDSAMLTVSNFTPAGKADRWLITPSFTVNSANMVFKWEDWESAGSQYFDSLQIWVSPTAGTTTASFTQKIWEGRVTAYDATPYGTHGASLAAFNGQTIRVAFRNNCTNQGATRIDNVQTISTLPAKDLALTKVTPIDPLRYKAAGGQINIGGTVTNMGASNVTSFVVKYQQGANPAVSQTITANLPPYGTGTFNFTTPYVLPATTGTYPIKVWVELTGDAVASNDFQNINVATVAFMPAKKLLFEEATGTWCQWCPRGAVYMDSMHNVNPVNTTLIAVHNGANDPMVVTAYDNLIKNLPGFPGFPAVAVDRREIIDPKDMFTIYNSQKDYFGFANISFTKPVISGTNLTTTVTVKPATDLTGDYRLALVITEEDVHGTSSGYAQVNVYNGGAAGNLVGAGLNWTTAGNPVPAANMYYDFVARAAFPSPSGAAGSLPATMTTGTNYTYAFTAPLDPSWNLNKIRVAVMMINNADGNVLNSNSSAWPLGVDDISPAENVSLYPNPATDKVNVSFVLNEKAVVTVEIIDALGRVINSQTSEMSAGSQKMSLSTANLTPGVYNVKLQTEKGSHTERLTVIK